MAPDDFESRLRSALTAAEEAQAAAMAELESCEEHPNSQAYKTVQWIALTSTGRALGLGEALGLLTGEENVPSLRQPGR